MPDLPPRPKLRITSTLTVHSGSTAVEPLSLTSSAATMWPDTPPVLFFRTQPDGSTLQRAFEALITAYPILGAQLSTTPPPSASSSGWGAHATRHARAWAQHDGPGATLLMAEWGGPLSDVLPSRSKGRALIVDPAVAQLCGAQLVVLRPEALARPGPPFAAQLTRFDDGVALAIKVHHTLADAHTAIALLRDWLTTYTALLAGGPLPALKGTWAPLIDAAASGDIDGDEPDAELVAEARRLPGLQLDFALAAPGATPVPFFKIEGAGIEGDIPPWESWDWAAPPAQRVLHFSAAEVDAMRTTAGVSRLDVLLARLWGAIVRARGLGPKDEVSLSSCVGLRARVEPPLGDEAYGTPLLLTASVLDAAAVASPAAVLAVRRAIGAYTPARIGAELHRMAFASDPVRRFTCFFGRYHTFSTSWLRLSAHEVKMGRVAPEWVLSGSPGADGLIVVLEAWDGVNVQLWLAEEVMARVLADPAITDIST